MQTMVNINSPVKSKINWTTLATQLIAVASIFNVIPPDKQAVVLEATLILGGAVIQFWRTFKTAK